MRKRSKKFMHVYVNKPRLHPFWLCINYTNTPPAVKRSLMNKVDHIWKGCRKLGRSQTQQRWAALVLVVEGERHRLRRWAPAHCKEARALHMINSKPSSWMWTETTRLSNNSPEKVTVPLVHVGTLARCSHVQVALGYTMTFRGPISCLLVCLICSIFI